MSTALEHTVQILRGMAYEHRLRLLMLLAESELTPAGLAAATGLEASLVAHHLRSLRDARLISRRRRGRNVYYALSGGPSRRLVEEVIAFAASHPHSNPSDVP